MTPNYDTVDQYLSIVLRDAVSYSGAGVNGKKYTVQNRNRLLNRANIDFSILVWGQFMSLFSGLPERSSQLRQGQLAVSRILQSQVKSLAITSFTALSVPADYNNIPISLTKTGSSTQFILVEDEEGLELDTDVNILGAYVIKSGTIRVWERLSGVLTLQTTGTGVFRYIQTDQVTQNSATDLALSPTYWHIVIDLAAAIAEAENGEVVLSEIYKKRALGSISLLR